MKNLLKSISVLALSVILLNCNNADEPVPAENGYASEQAYASANAREASSGATIQLPTKASAWRVAQTLTVPQEKGFNLLSPFAITAAGEGDISWGAYGCYSALKPVKVAFSNLGIVDISTVTPASLGALQFNQYPIANAPEGSAFWTNYMPAKTVIACKTPAGKHYLVEVLGDNPLKVNIYHAVRLLGQ
ncbi:hypothetical protein GCM10010967_33490 [Dyadobacter beijingensis]|uniref:Lipoprotein n=1 Tax=Dyadobacter beijingensis TaxID=365489 RepID=A0ABQ2I2G7_9BACT|nr:hypothetical protein [Dyadobacter beijingensis]GGM96979.1 hypothetical protein GCM10010967_33490 [Dyadobacter beijingensis]